MARWEGKLQSLTKQFSEAHKFSHDVYWLGNPTLTKAAYISPAFEKIWQRPSSSLLICLDGWISYLHPADRKNYHPLIEFSKGLKQEGHEARYDEIYRILTPDKKVRVIWDRGHSVCDEKGECFGVTGIASDITHLKLMQQMENFFPEKFFAERETRFYLKYRGHATYLTPREAECAFYFLKGKTAKEIAKIMHLSPRTIEDFLSRIKDKFNVSYRSDLFEALIESRFMEALR